MFFDHLPQQGLIGAHRGARSIAPENSFLSIDLARRCGAHYWETDVRLTQDGELIIFHDDTLVRTTNIAACGVLKDRLDHPVDQFTLDELHLLDMGSWFLTDDPFGTIADGTVSDSDAELIPRQQILCLTDVLEYSRSHSFPVNLEIKSLNTPPGDVGIVDQVLETIRESGTMEQVLLSSFRHEYLHRVKELSPETAIAVLVEDEHPDNLINYLHQFPAEAYHPDEAICDNELIGSLLAAEVRVNSWTVNDMERAEEMLAAGAGILTDWPQRLLNRLS